MGLLDSLSLTKILFNSCLRFCSFPSLTKTPLSQLLGKKIMHSESYIHSYPYDWRTRQPVILRGSKQWFVRTDKLREKALEAVQGVKIQPESAVQGFRGTIERRPYWCISRQRAWGTFIPVIYTLDGEPVVSEELLARSGFEII